MMIPDTNMSLTHVHIFSYTRRFSFIGSGTQIQNEVKVGELDISLNTIQSSTYYSAVHGLKYIDLRLQAEHRDDTLLRCLPNYRSR